MAYHNDMFPTILVAFVAGFLYLMVWSDKAAIRRYAKKKGWELTSIRLSMNLIIRSLQYRVIYVDHDGKRGEGKCHVSIFLGVVWDDGPTWKWLIP